MLLIVHICAGATSLVAGALALLAAKGSRLHRRSGLVFAIAMLVMTSTGAFIAAQMPERGSMLAGIVTFYLVATSLLTVKRPVQSSRPAIAGFMLLAFVAGVSALYLGSVALEAPNGRVDHLPAPPFFMFGTIALLGAALDARLLVAGRIEGKHRIARHLWRMTLAMLVATMSFFLGQPDLLPAPLWLRAIPVWLVLGTLVWQLIKTLRRRRSAATRIPHADGVRVDLAS
jgi:uncharacterized membrane protein